MNLRKALLIAFAALVLGYMAAVAIGGPLQAWLDRWTP